MYNYIKGTIIEKKENLLILENNGIGYELNVSMNTLENCGIIGEEVKIYTYYSVREDDISLFGFNTQEEKNLFLHLITVSGVGPKLALQVLSGAKLDTLFTSIGNGDVNMLSKIKGIGKKTAERIVVELKDKLGAFGDLFNYQQINQTITANVDITEACEVLVSLGMTKNEATKIITSVYAEGDKTEDLIRKSLQSMGR